MSDSVQVKTTFTGITIQNKTVLKFELSSESESELPNLTSLVNRFCFMTLEADQQCLFVDDEEADSEDVGDAEFAGDQTTVMDFLDGEISDEAQTEPAEEDTSDLDPFEGSSSEVTA